ncbi:hypothetical protein [Kribbella sp. NPDC055071]
MSKKVLIDRYTSIAYALTVYELRTGHRLGSATVAATPAECPHYDGFVFLEQPQGYLFPGETQYQQAIGQYVLN